MKEFEKKTITFLAGLLKFGEIQIDNPKNAYIPPTEEESIKMYENNHVFKNLCDKYLKNVSKSFEIKEKVVKKNPKKIKVPVIIRAEATKYIGDIMISSVEEYEDAAQELWDKSSDGWISKNVTNDFDITDNELCNFDQSDFDFYYEEQNKADPDA